MARPSPHRCTAKALSSLQESLREEGTSFAADEQRFSRLRLDHGLPDKKSPELVPGLSYRPSYKRS
jgi:hypothetical protein